MISMKEMGRFLRTNDRATRSARKKLIQQLTTISMEIQNYKRRLYEVKLETEERRNIRIELEMLHSDIVALINDVIRNRINRIDALMQMMDICMEARDYIHPDYYMQVFYG